MKNPNRIDIEVGIKLDSNLPRPIVINSEEQYLRLYGRHAKFKVPDVTPIPILETNKEKC